LNFCKFPDSTICLQNRNSNIPSAANLFYAINAQYYYKTVLIRCANCFVQIVRCKQERSSFYRYPTDDAFDEKKMAKHTKAMKALSEDCGMFYGSLE
jgi:hypothetical protein